MKPGPLNNQVNAASQLSDELYEKCLSIASDIAGYRREIERVECSDIDLDTAASTVGVLRAKIGVLEKREAQAEAAYARQCETVETLSSSLEVDVTHRISDTAAEALEDLNMALTKLLPKFQRVQTTQYLAGQSWRWRECFYTLSTLGFDSLKPMPALDKDAVEELRAKIREAA